jgi:amino acid adenylation domain-containing protein
MSAVGTAAIPVLDIGGLLRRSSAGSQAVAAEIRRAVEGIGGFAIAGHGLTPAMMDEASEMARSFFALPAAEKRLVAGKSGPGYSAMLEENFAGNNCLPKEAFNIMPEMGPRWPAAPAGFREILSDYVRRMETLSAELMRAFALALDLPEGAYAGKFGEALSFLRIVHYPPCSPGFDAGRFRCEPHTDLGTLTILRSQNGQGGLQMFHPDHGWFDVTLEDSALLITVGDEMERWTGGRWKATLHQVVVPPPESLGSRRLSLIYFHNPDSLRSTVEAYLKRRSVKESTDAYGRIAALPPDRRRLFEQMLAERRGPQMIPRRAGAGPWPLSFAQEGVWFLHQLDPARYDYNVPAALRLEGHLNTEALSSSLNTIVGRHEILRTRFQLVDGVPRQRVAAEEFIPLELEDVSALPDPAGEAAARMQREARRPFNLEQGPLLRAKLYRLGADRHDLLLTAHHIAWDGWSTAIFTYELLALYRARHSGGRAELPILPIQYADYSVWQREWLQGAALEEQLRYWREELAGGVERVNLPGDGVHPATAAFRSEVELFEIPAATARALQGGVPAAEATLFMKLLAGLQTLLHLYTGQAEIATGSPVAARNRKELENLLGFFANTVVLRTGFADDPAFAEVLARVRRAALGAYDHQELPFAKLIEDLRPERSVSRTAPVNVTFWLQTIPVETLALPDLTVTPLEISNGSTSYDLSLLMEERGDTLAGRLTYAADVFPAEAARRFVRDFGRVLETAALAPERAVSVFGRELEGRAGAACAASPSGSCLTGSQLLMWLGQQYYGAAPAYNEVALYTIHGAVDAERFARAFELLVDGNDALRTTLRVVDGAPQQRFDTVERAALELVDFSAERDPRAELGRFVDARKVAPFDFARRLYDTALVKLGESEYVWYLCLHHLITDAWSFRLVFDRLAEIYGALDAPGAAPVWPRYQSYIEHERAYWASVEHAASAVYWEKKLSVPTEPLLFYGRSAKGRSSRVERVYRDLGAARTERLRAIASKPGFAALNQDMALANIFTVLTLAYLHRTSGQAEIPLGMAFHNRSSKDFRETVGAFMVVCPLRVTVSLTETFTSLAAKVQAEMRETHQHSRHVTPNRPEESAYEAMINYFNVRFNGFQGMPVDVEMTHAGHGTDTFSVQVQNFDRARPISLAFDFAADVFDAAQRERAAEHFLRVLDAFLESQGALIGKVDVLTAKERTVTAAPVVWEAESVVDLFARRVAESPDAVAVAHGGRSWSYRELDARAGRIASELAARGAGPEKLVALCVRPSAEMLATLLAILKTGAAYLPLDPENPPARLRSLVENSGASLIVTRSHEMPSVAGAPVVDLDGVPAEGAVLPAVAVDPASLAYVIYTSGSTGVPKGVMATHQALTNYACLARDAFGLTAGDRVLQFAPLAFDTSCEEIFPTLAAGATLVFRDGGLESGTRFLRSCRDLGITVLDLPTAYWHALMAELPPGDLPLDPIRLVVIGGEQATAAAWEIWRNRVGSRVRLVNTYGPTESTIAATIAELTDGGEGVPPIGRPIANGHVWVLNHMLAPMPVGSAGELYVGGAGLARGYRCDAALTAGRFVADPFAADPGQRIYRTGDRARLLADGQLQYLGRADQQIKIRGYRVEPAEIERELLRHGAIRQAAVTTVTDAGGEAVLAAFLVGRTAPPPTSSELRRLLKEQLPEYMLPARWVWLEALPLNARGKVDFHALRLLAPAAAAGRADRIAPRTPEEKAIAEVCAGLLQLDPAAISVQDNFFDLGGHSLLGTQLMSRLSRIFEVEIPLRALFDAPTIDGLAAAIVRLKSAQAGPDRMEKLLADLEGLSEEELDWILANEAPFESDVR